MHPFGPLQGIEELLEAAFVLQRQAVELKAAPFVAPWELSSFKLVNLIRYRPNPCLIYQASRGKLSTMAIKATKVRKKRSCGVTREDARKLFNRQARKYLQMSGDEFIEKWKAGEFNGQSDTANVLQVAMLLPLAR